jgi:hypothetical protein
VNTTVTGVRSAAKANPSKQAAASAWEEKIHSPRLKIGQDRVNFGGRFLFDLQIFSFALDSSSPPYGPRYDARLNELLSEWSLLEAEAERLSKEPKPPPAVH